MFVLVLVVMMMLVIFRAGLVIAATTTAKLIPTFTSGGVTNSHLIQLTIGRAAAAGRCLVVWTL